MINQIQTQSCPFVLKIEAVNFTTFTGVEGRTASGGPPMTGGDRRALCVPRQPVTRLQKV